MKYGVMSVALLFSAASALADGQCCVYLKSLPLNMTCEDLALLNCSRKASSYYRGSKVCNDDLDGCDKKAPNLLEEPSCSMIQSVTFNASSAIVLGSTVQFTAGLPASMTLERLGANTVVDLASATIQLQIGSQIDGDGLSAFTMSGSGQFHPFELGGIPVDTSTFTVESGSGVIRWASGAVMADMILRVTAPGFPAIVVVAAGTGQADFTANKIDLLAAIDCAQPLLTPTLSEWGLLAMGLLTLAAGTIVLVRNRAART